MLSFCVVFYLVIFLMFFGRVVVSMLCCLYRCPLMVCCLYGNGLPRSHVLPLLFCCSDVLLVDAKDTTSGPIMSMGELLIPRAAAKMIPDTR